VGASLICDALADAGIEARAATIGPLEVVLAECAEFHPALVLVDLQMAHLDAAALAARLHGAASGAPRLLVCSGLPDAELGAHAARLSADAYISKSAGPAALVARVRELLPREAGA
jgi:DNA-binding response OmpR family regulator